MSEQQPRLTEDTLFLAFTRPAMVLGVPVEAMGVNIMLSGMIFLGAGNILYLGVGVVLHFVFKAIAAKDPNQFRILLIWLKTKARARNGAYWGGSSVTPLKLVRWFNKKDFQDA